MRQQVVEQAGIGSTWEVLVSGRLAPVRLVMPLARGSIIHTRQRWLAVNLATGRDVRVSAARLRRRLEGDDLAEAEARAARWS
jgi:hypothetical protein